MSKITSPVRQLPLLLRVNSLLRKSIFSRKFYQEINDKVLASSATVDKNLYFICYFTLLLSSILNNKPAIKSFLRKQLRHLLCVVNNISKSAFGKDLKTSTCKSVSAVFNDTPKEESNEKEPEEKAAASSEPVLKLAVHLKAISSYISDVRIFNRLTDSIKYAPWIIDEWTSLMNPAAKAPRFDRFVNFLQSMNCLVLELLENAGWLTDHNWVGTNDNNYWCIETYIWCARVWAAYVVIELLELFRRTPVSKWNKSWRIEVFKQAIQIPLVVHWSMYEGCLLPFWVGVCGSGASWWGFKDMWGSIDLS